MPISLPPLTLSHSSFHDSLIIPIRNSDLDYNHYDLYYTLPSKNSICHYITNHKGEDNTNSYAT